MDFTWLTGNVYNGMAKHVYHLRSMMFCYGQHYLAYVLLPGWSVSSGMSTYAR